MRHVGIAMGILIAGLAWAIPFSGAAPDGHEGKATPPNIETSGKKPAPAISADPRERPAAPDAKAQNKKWATPAGMPVYKPPLRSAPGGRVGGSSRGGGDELPMLSVLAPDHTGLTAQEQPCLYWYLSRSTPHSLKLTLTELTLIEAQAIRPLLETRISTPIQPGVQCVRLSDYGVRLSPGVAYRWFVALVVDPGNRSKDILAGGSIERIELPEALSARLAQASREEAPHIYAEAGLWYDALMAISDLIETTPNDPVLRNQRAALLEQVGLPEVAEHERRQAPLK